VQNLTLRWRNDVASRFDETGRMRGQSRGGVPVIVPDIDNPDMPLQMLFEAWPDVATVFLSHGMMCFGCPIAPFHSVIDACREYGLDEAGFRRELHAAIFGRHGCDHVLLRPRP
jgi:hybrid cluster-associated redox disulfide protein